MNKKERFDMIISQGTRKIKHQVIWFLEEIKGFNERKLFIFEILGKKTKYIVVLFEKDSLTGETFSQKFAGQTAKNIIERERCRVLYTSEDLKVEKGKPCGWVYGENKEIHDKKGNVIAVKQKSCDFFGQKETIKTLNHC